MLIFTCSMSREPARVSLPGESFRCAICLETARDAVDSDCCHQLYCAACTQRLTQCPTCRRSPFTVRSNVMLRRLINEIPTPCEHCKKMVALSDRDAHNAACEQRPIACTAPRCAFVGVRDALLKHMTTAHRDQLLKNYTRVFAEERPVVPEEEVVLNYFKGRGQQWIPIIAGFALLLFLCGLRIGHQIGST